MLMHARISLADPCTRARHHAARERASADARVEGKGKGSVAVGDAADTFSADLVVLSSSAVHEGHVDANLLVEFVPAPLLLLP